MTEFSTYITTGKLPERPAETLADLPPHPLFALDVLKEQPDHRIPDFDAADIINASIVVVDFMDGETDVRRYDKTSKELFALAMAVIYRTSRMRPKRTEEIAVRSVQHLKDLPFAGYDTHTGEPARFDPWMVGALGIAGEHTIIDFTSLTGVQKEALQGYIDAARTKLILEPELPADYVKPEEIVFTGRTGTPEGSDQLRSYMDTLRTEQDTTE